MMWAAISTKIGRAVGAKDYASIGKYFKMAARLGIGCGNPTLTARAPPLQHSERTITRKQ